MTAGQNIAQAKSSRVPTGLAILVTMVAVVGVFVAVSAMPHRAATAAAPAAVAAGGESRLEFLAANAANAAAPVSAAARIQAQYGQATATFPGLASTTADAARTQALYGEQDWYASSAEAARVKALYGDPGAAPQPLVGSSR